MENVQSAEKAYQQIDELKSNVNQLQDETKKASEIAEERLKNVEKALEGQVDRIRAEKAENRVKELEEEVSKLLAINNKLYSSIGVQVDEKPENIMSKEESAQENRIKELQAELDKQHKASLDAQLEKLKENNKQWL